MLTIRQMRYLLALAETRHFARAAALCNVTQPALSTQIKELEQTLGFAVIERKRAAAEFTAEGQEVLRRVTKIVTETRDLEDFAKQCSGLLVGPLVAGIIPSIAPYLLPLCLPLIQEKYPRLDLKLRETRTATLLRELAAGRVDVAILALPIDIAGVAETPLFDDHFLAAVARKEAKATPARLTPLDVPADKLLLLEEGHCLREQALSYCHLASAKNLATLGATSLTTVLEMVAAGYGITLLPELATRSGTLDPRIALKRFVAPEPKREVGMAWRSTTARSRDFTELARLIRAGYAKRSSRDGIRSRTLFGGSF
jgi:LysR family transcriptional regulator, hydrogen peroxide-inducible genes activator